MTATDMRLEVDVIPVSDLDQANSFYERLGWRLDDHVAPMDGRPGSVKAALIVADIEAAHPELAEQTGTEPPT